MYLFFVFLLLGWLVQVCIWVCAQTWLQPTEIHSLPPNSPNHMICQWKSNFILMQLLHATLELWQFSLFLLDNLVSLSLGNVSVLLVSGCFPSFLCWTWSPVIGVGCLGCLNSGRVKILWRSRYMCWVPEHDLLYFIVHYCTLFSQHIWLCYW